MKKILILASLLLVLPVTCAAQKFTLSANMLDYLNFGTLSIGGAYGLDRNWSLDFTAKYNPFTFHEGQAGKQFQNRQQAYSVGFRWWPWHLWSGWWMSGAVKYQEYNAGGLFSPSTEEGDRVGAGIAAGYSLMVHKHLNLDFGIGFWSGWSRFTRYSCPSCGRIEKSGQRIFILPDNVLMSLVYVF